MYYDLNAPYLTAWEKDIQTEFLALLENNKLKNKDTLLEVNRLLHALFREREGYRLECYAVEQLAGKALNYPYYYKDKKNFPDATKKDGVCIGEHVPVTIVDELVGEFKRQKKKIKKLKKKLKKYSRNYAQHYKTSKNT